MKKFIIWLAKMFDVNITKEVEVEKVVIEYRYLTEGTIKGSVIVEGDLTIKGKLSVNGGITLYKE
jgi:cytoskeletal protein CcmA (bactofilin family)